MPYLITSSTLPDSKPTAYATASQESHIDDTFAARIMALESRLNSQPSKPQRQSFRKPNTTPHKPYSSYPWPQNVQGTYCWLHGYNLHKSDNCLVMQDSDRKCAKTGKPYTSKMRSAATPNDVPGLKGNPTYN
jgi:hypothetical protein